MDRKGQILFVGQITKLNVTVIFMMSSASISGLMLQGFFVYGTTGRITCEQGFSSMHYGHMHNIFSQRSRL